MEEGGGGRRISFLTTWGFSLKRGLGEERKEAVGRVIPFFGQDPLDGEGCLGK